MNSEQAMDQPKGVWKMAKVKFGIIGCGKIAERNHVPGLLKNARDAEIVAMFDIVPEKAKALAKKYALKPKFHKDDLVAETEQPEEKKETEKKEDSVDKRIEELEKQLKAAEAKAKMWEAKAEEYYAANAKAAAPEQPEPEAAESVATVVSLATMQEWCKAHKGTSVVQYGTDTDSIWVYGVKRNEKQLKDELKAMGFAWAGKARHGAGWWAKPTA